MGLVPIGSINNWGHVSNPVMPSKVLTSGGLLGGTTMAWVLNHTVWKYGYTPRDVRRVFTGNAPIPLLLRGQTNGDDSVDSRPTNIFSLYTSMYWDRMYFERFDLVYLLL